MEFLQFHRVIVFIYYLSPRCHFPPLSWIQIMNYNYPRRSFPHKGGNLWKYCVLSI